MSSTATFPVITVEVESSYDEQSDTPGQDQHDVTVLIGGTPVFSRSYYEPANRHHGEETWDPVEHFGQIGAAQFGYTLAQMIDAFERGA